jgi:hypothetical protein
MGEKNPDPKNAPSQNAEKDHDGESIFEKVVPEGIKRGLEHLIRDGRVKNLVGELKLPKDLANQILSQMDETKQAAVKVVAKEVRTFLENTSLADEMAKLLTQISFEVSTNVRFVPSDKAMKRKGKEKAKKGSVPPDNPASDPTTQAADKPEPT